MFILILGFPYTVGSAVKRNEHEQYALHDQENCTSLLVKVRCDFHSERCIVVICWYRSEPSLIFYY